MPVIAVTRPRQSGKSTLIKHLFPRHNYLNLEDIELRQFAVSDPKAFLQNGGDNTIIDEVQYAPDLLSYILVITDVETGCRLVPVEIKSGRTINQYFFDSFKYFQPLPGALPRTAT